MDDKYSNVEFSVPYEIAIVRPLRQTTRDERRAALQAAFYNTELIPQELVYVDLKTDSGVSSLSTGQVARLMGEGPLESGLEMAEEGSGAFRSLAEKFREYFRFPYMLPVAQGRAAERLWAKLHVKPGSVVPGNMLFPSTRYHIEANGGKVLDVINDAAHNPASTQDFKGNVDLDKLTTAFTEHKSKVACVYVELCVNSCGGHPVSLKNLKRIKEITSANKVPLFLDACRILENGYLIKQREEGYRGHRVTEIMREICAQADGCTMSALKNFSAASGGFIGTRDEAAYQKAFVQSFLDGVQPSSAVMEALGVALDELLSVDAYAADRVTQVEYLWRRLKGSIPVLHPAGGHGVFIDVAEFLPHVDRAKFPAESLAAYIYETSGVRVTKGPPLAPSQSARGVELLRMAVPARRYLRGHMDDAAEAVLYAYAQRREISGLKRIEKAGRPKYAPALFARMEA